MDDVGQPGASTVPDPLPRLHAVAREAGVGWYPLVALGGLAIGGGIGTHALVVLLPEIGRTLGFSAAGLSAVLAGRLLLSALAALPLAGMVQRRAVRALLAGSGAAAMGACLAGAALAVRPAEFTGAILALGAASAVVAVAHQPLVVELYPPVGRVRALAVLAGARAVGEVVAPLLVALLVVVVDLTWRGVFLVAGIVMGVAAVGSLGLRDPGFGRWDGPGQDRTDPRPGSMASLANPSVTVVPLSLGAAIRRLHAIPTLRRLFAFQAGLGAMLVPLLVFLVLYLEVRWAVGPMGRAVVFSLTGVAAVVSVALVGPIGERRFHRDPEGLVLLASRLWVVALVLMAATVAAPNVAVVALLLAGATALVAALAPALAILRLSLVPPRLRSTTNAVAVLWFAGAGGLLGILLFGAADRRYGLGGAILVTLLPGAVAILALRAARMTLAGDLEAMTIDRAMLDASRLPDAPAALEVHRLHVARGGPTVLQAVSFQLRAGEVVALLGHNGVGKTTLLHALAGLVPTRAGRVRVAGREITHLDAERRPSQGLVFVGGPDALFDPLTVNDHLRLFLRGAGIPAGMHRATVEEIERRLPALAARGSVAARELSGGERRLLGLARAVITRPAVLLVDEFALGLAPDAQVAVMEVIARAAAGGSAVLVVDQSPEVARRVAQRAIVLDRGVVAFDGPVAELGDRRDLLTPVFLPDPP